MSDSLEPTQSTPRPHLSTSPLSDSSALGSAGEKSSHLHHPSRAQQITQQLQAMLAQLEHGTRLPTVRALCAQFHVSARTVNAALEELEDKRLVRRVHGVGVFVGSNRAWHVAIVIDKTFLHPTVHSPFWSLLNTQIQNTFVRRGFGTSLYICDHVSTSENTRTPHLPSDLLNAIAQGNSIGVVALGLDNATMQWLHGQNVPAVSFAGSGQWLVGLNSQEIVLQGVLALLRRGCRRLSLWRPIAPGRRTNIADGALEIEVFRQHLLLNSLPFDPILVFNGSDPDWRQGKLVTHTHGEQGHAIARYVFQEANEAKPDGIIITDDMMANGALQLLDDLHIPVGRKVVVATHANSHSSVLDPWKDRVILLEVDLERIAAALCSTLEALTRGETPAAQHLLLEPQVRDPL